jgi:hypothetical protein
MLTYEFGSKLLPLFITEWSNLAWWSLCGFEINPWAVSPSELDGVWGLKAMTVYRNSETIPKTYFNIRPLTMKTKLHMYRPSKCAINKNA